MTSSHENIRPEETRQPKAILGKDLNFVELAKATKGQVSWRGDDPYISWSGDRVSLDVRDYGNGKTFFLWRGEWGGSGMEHMGFVQGHDFAAFIRPTSDKNVIKGEMIKDGKVSFFEGAKEMYHPAFQEAKNIATENAETLGLKLDPAFD